MYFWDAVELRDSWVWGASLRKRYTCLLSWSSAVVVRFCSFLLMTSVGYSFAGLYVVLSVVVGIGLCSPRCS